MTRKPLTNEQRIEIYTELQRRVQVGAYLELQHDGSFPEDDGTPESTTLESLHNLETWAERQGLEFCWNHDDSTWSLVPLQSGDDDEQAYLDAYTQGPGDGSGLHQCQYCYTLVNEEHEEFCRLNPNRNREVMP